MWGITDPTTHLAIFLYHAHEDLNNNQWMLQIVKFSIDGFGLARLNPA